MPTQSDKKFTAQARTLRVESNHVRPGTTGFTERFRFHAKRLAWRATVRTAYAFKRLFDAVVAALLLALSAPLLAGIALLIRLDSSGPVLHRRTRLGRWGRLITLWSFRCESFTARATVLAGNSGRCAPTRVGRRLRAASLDKLPQLWNVLRGDISLFGPPSAPLSAVDGYSLSDRKRLEISPGLVELRQASTTANGLDSAYHQSASVLPALRCLARLIPAILFGRAAY